MTSPGSPAEPSHRTGHTRALLTLAAVAVAFAAADTYVVVLALPDLMQGVGLSVDELQRAAPIVSGFLLGYVAMLPLIGRISDLRGRVPVLVAGLVVFAAGSLVTALAYDLPSLVCGRFFQGVGGGALVPATLALVADLYPVERRGVPLGLVSAVQEIGSVLGPLLGAVVLAVADWRAIFGLNLVVGAVLAVAIGRLRRVDAGPPADPSSGRRVDVLGLVLLCAAVAAGVLTAVRPEPILRDLTWGQLYIPVPGLSPFGRWVTPLGLATIALLAGFVLRCLFAARPAVDLRGWWRAARTADLPGAVLLAVALGGVILTFATADPQVELISPQGGWYLAGSAVATIALVVHLRRTPDPLIPTATLRPRAAWGGVLVSFFVGAALVAALIDIPLFARTTVHSDSQLMAALVLVRFLIALPAGAVVGGWLLRRLGAGIVAGVGMLLAAAAFVLMSRWDLDSLAHFSATVPLLLGGFGFGLALAPVNAAVLAVTAPAVHGLAGALVVVARMIGMLVGISALTALGLRRYYAEQADVPPAAEVCGGPTRCDAYNDLLQQAGIAQEQVVFAGAAVCAVLAAVLAIALFRGAPTRELPAGEALRGHR
ncbi:MFS transporter [Nocardioides insulae]|uniref:MFS transporter n=1 Tax=Nocardioides insulae TaxID=394734 RepID=UPI0003F5368A|nr:MFS transporter [Nocardioides insulae]